MCARLFPKITSRKVFPPLGLIGGTSSKKSHSLFRYKDALSECSKSASPVARKAVIHRGL